MRANSLNTHRKRDDNRLDSTPELPHVNETVGVHKINRDPKIKSHFHESLNNVLRSKGKKVRIANVVIVADEQAYIHSPNHSYHRPLKSSLIVKK